MFNNRRTLTMDWYLPSPKWMFLINAILILLHVSVAKTLEPILWDKHLFQRHGPEGVRIEAEINDVVDIICPKINDTLSPSSSIPQYHAFTQVSKLGYENCDLLTDGDLGAKTLLRCNRPLVENELRLLFQEQTTYPGDPVFELGRDYYFITTADGTQEGIDQKTGGLCRSHYMKLIIHMNGDVVTHFPPTPPREGGRPSSTTRSLPARSPTQTSPSESTKFTTSTVKPTRRKVTNKKPNNSGKNDELKGDNNDNGSSHQCPSSMLLLICSLVAFVRWFRH